jgi:hypothetical protein
MTIWLKPSMDKKTARIAPGRSGALKIVGCYLGIQWLGLPALMMR